MHRSTDRILTTHVGSLPRSQAVVDVLFARQRAEAGAAANACVQAPGEGGAVIAAAGAGVVRGQVAVGVDGGGGGFHERRLPGGGGALSAQRLLPYAGRLPDGARRRAAK